MHIRRIAVKNFRKLLDVEVENIGTGLTVVVGENEEGKSTMLKALQAAFFERHNYSGKAAKGMLPFGSKVRPEIGVDFEANDVEYRLKKGFIQSPSALLESNSQKWQNAAAEEKLREILGFTSPRGATSKKHHGLSGLLWVEQGRAFNPLELNQDTLSSVHEAIEGEVGQVTGGERGRKLLEAIDERYSKYFTPTGREKQKLKDAQDKVEALQKEVNKLESELSEYEGKVDRLQIIKEKLERYEKEDTLGHAENEEKKAANAEKILAETEGKCEIASAELDAAEKSFEIIENEHSNRNSKIEKLKKYKSAILDAKKLLEQSEEARRETTESQSLAEEQMREARKDFEKARSDLIAAQRRLKREEALASLGILEERLDRAQKVKEEVDNYRISAKAIGVTEENLVSLKKIATELDRKRAALEAVATTIEFSPTDDQIVTVDDWTDDLIVDTDIPLRIKERTSLELEGFGELTVTPGGEDIRLSRITVDNLQSNLKSSLDELGYSSIGEAEENFRKKSELLIEREKAQALLDGIVPEGLEHLESDIKVQRETLASMTVDEDEHPVSKQEAQRLEENALSAEEEAENERKMAERILEAENKKLSEAKEEWIKNSTSFETTKRDMESLEQDINTERANKSDEQLKEELSKAERRRDERELALDKLTEQLDAMSPDLIRSERERTQEVLSNLKQQIDREKQQARDLEVELRTIGQTGLGEKVEEERSKHTQAEQTLERLLVDAEAWRLLKETLEKAEREAKETFIAPVREHLQPYMRYVLPRTSLNLDADSLEIDSLQRDGLEEPFQSLSVGTREQIAVLARLALGEILQEDNKPVAIILDDPLVNSDDERFRLMSAALRKAAKKMQVLILTCHEQRYQSLGARMVPLQDCYRN